MSQNETLYITAETPDVSRSPGPTMDPSLPPTASFQAYLLPLTTTALFISFV